MDERESGCEGVWMRGRVDVKESGCEGEWM